MQHITIRLDGNTYPVRYDWAAIARLQKEIGTDFDAQITRAQLELDLNVLAAALACGIADPKVTPEFIRECSPPITRVSEVITDALTHAFHGGKPPESPPENPPHARPASSWIARFVRRIGRALHLTSGD